MTKQEKAISTDEDLLAAKLHDAETTSYMVSTDPDEAEKLGAFVEDALSESDAIDSSIDKE